MDTLKMKTGVDNIQRELKTYIEKSGLKALVLGLSGGIDSALCAALAAPVCRELGVELIGRSITIETNKQDEIERGEMIGKAFCTSFKPIDLTHLYTTSLEDILEEYENGETDHERKVRLGNIKARLRMIYLYNLAQQHKGLVLSTDNYTEYLLGFWTLHGDVGDYGMIQELWKEEVYDMSQYLVNEVLEDTAEKAALQACIDATPTDGLGITGSDLEQLGVDTYAQVDAELKQYSAAPDENQHLKDSPVIQRHIRSGYKRNNPLNLTRKQVFGE